MGRFLLGVITTLVVLAGLVGALTVMEQSGMADVKPVVINTLGKLPGWTDLPKTFSAGKKGLKNWEEKEKTYQARVDALNNEIAKLKKELDKAQNTTTAPAPDKAPTTPSTPSTSPPGKVPNNKVPDDLVSAKHAGRLLAQMKPQAAADILIKIQPDVALSILQQMDARSAAMIIQAMPVDSGSALMAKLATKH